MSLKLTILILFTHKHLDHQVTAQVLHYSYKNVLSTEYRCEFFCSSLEASFENATELSTPHLPDKTDDDVDSIEFLHRSYASTFPTMICTKFKNLKHINMDKGFIEKLNEKTFENCTNLERMLLNVATEESLWENFFATNIKLRNLKIFSISLKTLARSFLANVNETLTELEMTIASDSFTFPSDFLQSLSNLKSLELYIGKLTNLPPTFFENLEKLELLYLVDCNIHDLPKGIFKTLKNLQDLDLSKNSLKVIHSDSFGSHPSLMTVNLSGNGISSIDPKFLQMPSLLYIYLNSCGEIMLVEYNTNGTVIKKHSDICTRSYKPRD